MKIYLIRHGETIGDLEDRYGGDYDDHLTEEGKSQARKLAEKLNGDDIHFILHSPRIRAVETAQIVSKEINVPVEEIENLKERNSYGILTGMIKSEAKERFPDEVDKIDADRLHHSVAESESYESFSERVLSIFEDIMKNYQDDIAIVTHGGVVSTFVRDYLKLGESELGDCSICELKIVDGTAKLTALDGAKVGNSQGK